MLKFSTFRPPAIAPESFFFWSWVVSLCWAPIPIGGSFPIFATAILEVAVFGLAILWLVSWRLGLVAVTEPFRRAKWLLVLMALWLVYQLLYVLPLPIAWIEVASPQAGSLHRLTIGQTDDGALRTLSIDPGASQAMWLKSLLYITSFAATLLVVTGRERARQLAISLVVTAFCISFYAMMMHLTQAKIVWFGGSLDHASVAIGTYRNRNLFAGYLAMSLAIGIGLLIADLRDTRIDSWRRFFITFLEWVFSRKMQIRLALCVMVIALVSTRSRMGNTAFFASLLIAGAVGLALSRHAKRGTVVLLTSLLVIDLFIVGSYFGVEQLAKRIEQTAMTVEAKSVGGEQTFEERGAAAKYALQIIADFPTFGSGPGSFYVVFPRYRGADIEGFYDYAHNDYAELTVENGLIGIGVLGTIVLWCLAVALRAQYQRRDPLMRGLSFASIMGIFIILIHSTTDGNMTTPANAMLFMVILAFGWISRYLGSGELGAISRQAR